MTLDDESKDRATGYDEAGYEEEEDELDPDCPYPSIVQDMDIDLGVAVLDLVIPSLPPFPLPPRLLQYNALIMVACADGSTSVVTVPLLAPSEASKQVYTPLVMPLESPTGPKRRSITAKICGVDVGESVSIRRREDGEYIYGTLLVANAADHLSVSRLDITETQLLSAKDTDIGTWRLPTSATQIAFHPSSKLAHLLITDRSGAARIFDPLGMVASQRRPSSRDSAHFADAGVTSGKWVMTYHAPYIGAQISMARRKRILAAQWALSGRAILALLEDGEWGMWDVAGSVHNGKDAGRFVLGGFLGSSASTESTSSQKKGASKLAPMTPNTRRSKAENLFSGPPKVPGLAAQGGMSIATSATKGAQLDETVVMWHNGEIYSIQSLLTFWQRSTSSGGGGIGGLGSLYSPGLVHITDVNLMNESITSIAQLAVKSSSANSGRMNAQRDFIVSTEHRIVISQSLPSSANARTLFQQPDEQPVPRDRDLKMLDAGDLDIGGMDRLLDSMATADARPRKVGFRD